MYYFDEIISFNLFLFQFIFVLYVVCVHRCMQLFECLRVHACQVTALLEYFN